MFTKRLHSGDSPGAQARGERAGTAQWSDLIQFVSGVREAALPYGMSARTAPDNPAPTYGNVFTLPLRAAAQEDLFF